MKLVYKKTIEEKINEAIQEAWKDNRQVEKVLLTPDEWREFTKYLDTLHLLYPTDLSINVLLYWGIPIIKEEEDGAES